MNLLVAYRTGVFLTETQSYNDRGSHLEKAKEKTKGGGGGKGGGEGTREESSIGGMKLTSFLRRILIRVQRNKLTPMTS